MKVSNTGPLIVLHETSLLWLLKELYTEIIIPKAVQLELLKKSDGQKIVNTNWIKVVEVQKSDILSRPYNLNAGWRPDTCECTCSSFNKEN